MKFQMNWISKYRDELFGVAILMIIIFHFTYDYGWACKHGIIPSHGIGRYLVLKYLNYIGSIGVEIFVFLSGMGAYYSFSKEEKIAPFYSRRMKRILLPYLIVAIPFWTLKDFFFNDRSIVWLFEDFTFISIFTRRTITIWFIFLMIVMYVIFPFIYHIMYKTKNKRIDSILLLFAFSVLPFILISLGKEYMRGEIVITRIPIFLIGTYCGIYIKENKEVSLSKLCLFTLTVIIVNFSLVHFNLKYPHSIPNVVLRYSDTLMALGLIAIIIYILKYIDKIVPTLNEIFRGVGKYSLELYLTHVTMRNLMVTMKFHSYEIYSYFVMITCAIITSILLKKIIDSTNRVYYV